MKKVITSIVLSLFCLPILIQKAETESFSIFHDVNNYTLYAEAIEYLYEYGIINGYPDGSYGPLDSINRAEFTKILIEALFDTNSINNCLLGKHILFSDTPMQEWFSPHVCQATKENILSGYPNGTFGPALKINFAEAAKIIVLGFGIPYQEVPQGEWYEGYTNALKDIGAWPPSISSPSQLLTRAEMAEMIYRVFQYQDASIEPEETLESTLDTFKKAVIKLLNKERTSRGLSSMSYNPFLEQAAQGHANDMRDRNYFDHETPEGTTAEDRIQSSGYLQPFYDCACTKSYTVGENIAKGQETAEEVMETWMNSPEHRENILNPSFSEIGIGMTPVDPNDTGFVGYFWVQNFGNITLE